MPMSETFKVESTLGREEWTGNYGPMLTYRLAVNGGQEVDLNQKPETPAPQIGDEIWGHLEDGKYRPKLKKDKKDGGGSWGGGGDELGPVIHRQVALKIIAPLIYEAGRLTDAHKVLCRQIEAFIGEASDDTSSTNGAVGDDIGVRILFLLEEAGLEPAGAGRIADYMTSLEMSPEERAAATAALEGDETREAAVKRLRERVEQFDGEALPTGTDDDIPF
jgi:hypothetical protein